MATTTLDGVSESGPAEALSEVLTTARAAMDYEADLTERLDSKARGLATLAGQWFAIVQAVSAVAYAKSGVSTLLLILVAIAAVGGAAALGFTFLYGSRVWKLRDEHAVTPAALVQLKTSVVRDPRTIELLVDHYAARLRDRRKTNGDRAAALECAQQVWLFAMAIPIVQLLLALLTRLLAA